MSTTSQRILSLPLSLLLAGGVATVGCGAEKGAELAVGTYSTEDGGTLRAEAPAAAASDDYGLSEDVPPLPEEVTIEELPEAESARLAERERRLEQREAELALREREAELARREAEVAARERQAEAPVAAAAAPRREEPAASYEPPVRRATRVTVPAGTAVEVELLDGVSSETSKPGDTVRARVSGGVYADDVAAIPAGSEVIGVVRDVQGLRRVGGRARLAVDFTELVLPSGEAAPIQASYTAVGKSETAKDAATIGGAAAAGGVLGKQIDKDRKGAVIGAIIGAAAGTAIATKTRGRQITLPAGTALTLSLEDSVTVRH